MEIRFWIMLVFGGMKVGGSKMENWQLVLFSIDVRITSRRFLGVTQEDLVGCPKQQQFQFSRLVELYLAINVA